MTHTAAVDAAARAHFDRNVALRRDRGQVVGDEQRPHGYDDLSPADRDVLCAFVEPIVAAALKAVAA